MGLKNPISRAREEMRIATYNMCCNYNTIWPVSSIVTITYNSAAVLQFTLICNATVTSYSVAGVAGCSLFCV